MLKKIIILILCLQVVGQMQAQQFLRGFGFFVGATESRHRYINSLPVDSFNFAHTYNAPSHHSAEYFSWSVGILGEFLKYDKIRWQTEFEYCNKGAIESELLDRVTGERGPKVANTYANIQWNNYAKIFIREGYRGLPYVMLGARLEYNFKRATPAYALVAGSIPKIAVTPDVALGYEFIVYSRWKPFVEFHYNPDLIKFKQGPVTMWNRTFELRVGLIFRPAGKAFDDCNAPTFRGKAY